MHVSNKNLKLYVTFSDKCGWPNFTHFFGLRNSISKVELSRANTQHACTSTIAAALYTVSNFKDVYERDDPYLRTVQAGAAVTAHGITGCGQKVCQIERHDL